MNRFHSDAVSVDSRIKTQPGSGITGDLHLRGLGLLDGVGDVGTKSCDQAVARQRIGRDSRNVYATDLRSFPSDFADRQFYEDWWNSTSWDEFSRKWNKPVHTFLLHHVYASTIDSYQLSRTSAMFVTFLLSACVHELVMVVVTKKFRMYLFLLQLIQIPLIMVSRLPIIKRNKLMGNIVFWLGLYAGFPLLCVAYVAY
ncbi:MBOAT, membrane-bound O-acyltransferase family-domain-containing protein [Mycena polygramma]|nr:MBOAT, membrane-bound O-acyltransferase family-domain-containing protein [Mycena polygramma]